MWQADDQDRGMEQTVFAQLKQRRKRDGDTEATRSADFITLIPLGFNPGPHKHGMSTPTLQQDTFLSLSPEKTVGCTVGTASPTSTHPLICPGISSSCHLLLAGGPGQ